jgi:hypothetical protein
MLIASKIVSLLGKLSRQDIDELPPIERQRFAQLCRHWAAIADRRADEHLQRQQGGVLGDLGRGQRGE